MSLKPHHVLRVEPPRLLFQGLKIIKILFFFPLTVIVNHSNLIYFHKNLKKKKLKLFVYLCCQILRFRPLHIVEDKEQGFRRQSREEVYRINAGGRGLNI